MTQELSIPDDIDKADEAIEMVRFWLADGDAVMSLNLGIFEPEHEAHMWGFILADTMKHAVRGMLQRHPEIGDVEGLLAQVETGMRDRLRQSPEFSGQVQRSQH